MKSVVAIGTHPDDIEIGCGGTLSLLKEKGYSLHFVVATSGEQGDFKKDPKSFGKHRKAEALLSAKLLGAKQVFFLKEPDGLSNFQTSSKIRLISLLREIRPEIVFTHAKSDCFPDHRVIHDLTMAAVIAAAGPWYPKAVGRPYSVCNIYGYEVWNPISNHQLSVDITLTFSKKVRALKAHKSQIVGVNYLAAIEGLAQYRGAMSMTGKYAEVFEVMRSGNIQ